MNLLQTAPGLADQVYQAVVDDICDGVIGPGEHLVQEQLAAHFGVSRQPIQQAMALLKADGLVEDVGKRGLRVAELDLTMMRHHYDIRAAFDGLAARLAAERCRLDPAMARAVRDRGERLLADGQDAIARNATLDLIRADEAFHKLIYETSGNPLLDKSAEPHWRFLRRTMGEVLRHAEPPATIWRQHAAILDAIAMGDAARATQLATYHISVAADTLANALETSGPETAAP